MRVLLIENDLTMSVLRQNNLGAHGMRTETADTGEDALELLRHYQFDILILSACLPDLNGTRMISRIRNAGVTTPILMLASRRSRDSVQSAFAVGADDVVDEAVEDAELVARMQAIVRRARGHSQSTLRVGDLCLDLERHEVTANGTSVTLTGREFELLRLLMLRKNMPVTKETILDQLYGGLDEPEMKIIDVFVCKIRKKLARAGLGHVIGTIWGRGYTIQDASNRRPSQPAAPTPQPDTGARYLVAA